MGVKVKVILVGWEEIGHFTCGHIRLMLMISDRMLMIKKVKVGNFIGCKSESDF